MPDIVLKRRHRYQLQKQLKHAQDASLYRRTLAILEIDQGKPVAAVAEALGVTRQTVYNWLGSYGETYDPLALVDAARSGRPSSWTPDLQELGYGGKRMRYVLPTDPEGEKKNGHSPEA